MGYPHYDLVERAYNELKAEGKIPMGNVEHDKGLITQRAGWYSYERDSTMGVLEKTSGNNYLGYSVDILIRTNGQYYDIVTDKNGEAVPVNGGPSTDTELIPRWRKPSAELAQITEDGGGSEPEPPGPDPEPPTTDLQPVLDAIAASEARIQANVTQQGEETRQLIERYADQVDQWATAVLAAWLLMNRQEPGAAKRAAMTESSALEQARKALDSVRTRQQH